MIFLLLLVVHVTMTLFEPKNKYEFLFCRKIGCMLYFVSPIQRMRFITQWQAAFRFKSFKAVVIRKKWLGGGGGEMVVGDQRSLVEEPHRRCFSAFSEAVYK